ncbi:MAG TPA: lysophospholipid acyltransferase family protein [Pseudoxanthomonas sp.]|nr:lysophospholipid acyltransferase family protein [Pseudoxanthomonas sp.]
MSEVALPSVLRKAMLSIRAYAKLLAVLLTSVLLVPLQALVMAFTRGPPAFVVPRLWHRCLCRILGIEVEVMGTPNPQGRTLYVGNHISHFDILLLGSVLRTRFIAKDDMLRWPGVPFIAGLQQTVFISRRGRDAASAAMALSGVMGHGNNLLLFAEGTTSSGSTVAPFKSSLFSLFTGGSPEAHVAWTVQPFTLVLQAVEGHALRDDGDRDLYAYHGDMDAGAHVQQFLRSRGAQLLLVLHAPISVAAGTDRKTLAALTHAVVASALHPDRDTEAPVA